MEIPQLVIGSGSPTISKSQRWNAENEQWNEQIGPNYPMGTDGCPMHCVTPWLVVHHHQLNSKGIGTVFVARFVGRLWNHHWLLTSHRLLNCPVVCRRRWPSFGRCWNWKDREGVDFFIQQLVHRLWLPPCWHRRQRGGWFHQTSKCVVDEPLEQFGRNVTDTDGIPGRCHCLGDICRWHCHFGQKGRQSQGTLKMFTTAILSEKWPNNWCLRLIQPSRACLVSRVQLQGWVVTCNVTQIRISQCSFWTAELVGWSSCNAMGKAPDHVDLDIFRRLLAKALGNASIMIKVSNDITGRLVDDAVVGTISTSCHCHHCVQLANQISVHTWRRTVSFQTISKGGEELAKFTKFRENFAQWHRLSMSPALFVHGWKWTSRSSAKYQTQVVGDKKWLELLRKKPFQK